MDATQRRPVAAGSACGALLAPLLLMMKPHSCRQGLAPSRAFPIQPRLSVSDSLMLHNWNGCAGSRLYGTRQLPVTGHTVQANSLGMLSRLQAGRQHGHAAAHRGVLLGSLEGERSAAVALGCEGSHSLDPLDAEP